MRLSVSLEGVVQGVGMRPFVHALATRLGLAGFVVNDGHGVTIEVEGDTDRLRQFVADLEQQPPPLAVIERLRTVEVPARHATAFVIADSADAGRRDTLVPPDTATCDDCLREIFDPADRRFRYAFTNCTGWGAPDGAPLTSRTTLVWLSPALVSVAVPDSPELFWGASFADAESAASAKDVMLARSRPNTTAAMDFPTFTIE